MSYVYMRIGDEAWEVGFYHLGGAWEPEGYYGSWEEAAARVAWLNGGGDTALAGKLTSLADWMEERLDGDEPDRWAFAGDAVAQLRELAALARGGAS